MEELIKEYKQSLKTIKQAKERAEEEEHMIYSEMISDLEFALEWMQTARRAGNRRGIERRAVYQREKVYNPLLMQRYCGGTYDNIYEWDNHEKEHTIGAWERIQLEDALSVLTVREKEIYLMHRGYCLSYGKIAESLVISRSTVQNMIERAGEKIVRQIKQSLFCCD
ncbi:RNA polymerase subunit sigma-24 [Bacillus toyonensis]|uniref:sigma-70 family RNA polymerase sigma factor n=1 Tax=Bacillus toyonensis TaxID=155322 RepID=UPI000BF23029|nr:sigma-70 family RNA polymerase sigma factor [Bacillus toyonensis]PEO24951.1 RNA polymerase subunit sigma-24 [Bacillus toyonensis]PFX45612.1 RNA polymerase subunit sigma-24 [Bacillus toyonensis]PFX97233.1 RNA polymerase subunit sigma-24 [Bacillus toyonensis]PHB76845.1 RNA polymerase subunit sigma-24 [Bacillus toyonensis]